MKINKLMLLIVLVFSVVSVPDVNASCKQGKSPVYITTGNGITKTICVSDAGIAGIEKAAEHSGGMITPVSCPCFGPEDIVPLFDSSATCSDYITDDSRDVVIRFVGQKTPFVRTTMWPTKALSDNRLTCSGNLTTGPNYFTEDIRQEEFTECVNVLYSTAEALGIACGITE